MSVGWGLRASRLKERIQIGRARKIARECWLEKKRYEDGKIDMGKKKKNI